MVNSVKNNAILHKKRMLKNKKSDVLYKHNIKAKRFKIKNKRSCSDEKNNESSIFIAINRMRI